MLIVCVCVLFDRYTYRDLHIATNGFKTILGEGGSGQVYRGVLPGGIQVAVKALQSALQGDKEFRTEVATIGNIHHINLVRLRGFCLEGTHRLLVYEYMVVPNLCTKKECGYRCKILCSSGL